MRACQSTRSGFVTRILDSEKGSRWELRERWVCDAGHENSNGCGELSIVGCSPAAFIPESGAMTALSTVPPRRDLNHALLCVTGFAVLALGSYGFFAYDLLQTLFQDFLAVILVDRDFANYWLAGRLVLAGEHLDLFTHARYFPRLQELFGPDYQIRSWSYPPHYLLLVWPLGLVGYKAGFIAFMGSTLVLFGSAAAIFRREYAPTADVRILLLALLGYVLMMFVAAQNGFLTGALLLFGLTYMRRRPLLAGIAFGLLTIKPQLGLLIPVLLVFDRNWKALAWAAIAAVLLMALSAMLFGLASWFAYFTDTLNYQRSVMTDWYGIFLRMMPTVFGSFRTLGFSPSTAAQAQLPTTVCAFAAVLWLLWRERDELRRVFAVTCATFLITPYAFNYDMGALCVCAATLAGQRRKIGRRALSLLPIAMVAGSPAAVMNLGRAGIPCTPLILVAGLAALVVAARRVNGCCAETRTSSPSGS